MILRISLVTFFIVQIFIAYPQAQFGPQIDSGLVECKDIKEASGIAASKKNPGVLWTHNDAGDKNHIFAMNGNGKHLGVFVLENCEARDWEDIATGPGPTAGNDYIYVGNIGDNDTVYDLKYVYRCVEPVVLPTQSPKTDTIREIDILKFRFPDGKWNAEALMVDPLTKDYYIISKRESNARVYRAQYPQPISTVDTLECVDTLAQTYIVAADISSSGDEIIMKNDDSVYYWKIAAGETIKKTLSRSPVTISYTKEPQGEGLTWDANANGYFTISEEKDDIDCHLYYYPRLVNSIITGNTFYRQKSKSRMITVISNGKVISPETYLLTGQCVRDKERTRTGLRIRIEKNGRF
jgi:hypothetical protein